MMSFMTLWETGRARSTVRQLPNRPGRPTPGAGVRSWSRDFLAKSSAVVAHRARRGGDPVVVEAVTLGDRRSRRWWR
jgi:hypothetical protein